jgi:hypothetical protein
MANLLSLSSGTSVVLTVTDGQSIVLNNGPTDRARLEITTGRGSGTVVTASHNGRREYGPFSAGTITLAATSGAVRYELSGDTASQLDDDAQPLTASENQSVRAIVWGASMPTDLLVPPLQRVTITGAMSTTAAQAAAATGTYYKARVAWNNNGASGTAKLRIAVNADNDVHGLMIGQNAKRRDYELTMGDAVMLVCGVPITRLTFSADGSITGGTHQLQVTFGN